MEIITCIPTDCMIEIAYHCAPVHAVYAIEHPDRVSYTHLVHSRGDVGIVNLKRSCKVLAAMFKSTFELFRIASDVKQYRNASCRGLFHSTHPAYDDIDVVEFHRSVESASKRCALLTQL